MNNFKEINVDKWVRKTTFEWFRKFSNPTYCFNVKIDVDDIVKYSKNTGTSFFINFLYVVCRVNNEVESLRLRYVDNRVLLFDKINPTFTVTTTDGHFNNAACEYISDYQQFYKLAKEEIARRSGPTDNSKTYNDQDYNVFYSSCLTTIEIEGMRQPLNTNDPNSLNVPRIFWDKYRLENGRYVMLLSMNVSHILVDGEQLSSAFNLVKKYCLDFKKIL